MSVSFRHLRKPLLFALFVLPIAGFLLFTVQLSVGPTVFPPVAHLTDDSMVTLRVAANFWRYSVPYFNVSEAVAANTSLFWPIIISPIFMLPDTRFVPVIVISVISAMAIPALTYFFAKQLAKPHKKLLLIILICFSNSSLVYAATGWEHIPQLLSVNLGFFLILQNKNDDFRKYIFGIYLISISFIFRSDISFLTIVVFIGLIIVIDRNLLSKYLLYLSPIVIIPVTYLFLMDYYYDSFVPNTFFLKSTGIENRISLGIKYVINPMKSGYVPIALVCLLCVWKKLDVREKVILISCLAHVVFIVFIGGDVFSGGRFFLVLLPITALLLINRLPLFIPALIVCVFCLYPIYRVVSQKISKERSVMEISLGNQLGLATIINQSLVPEDGSIGLHNLGIAYHLPDFHVVDFLGKAEPYIARLPAKSDVIGHNKWDYDYALSKYNIAAVPISAAIYRMSLELESVEFRHKGYAFAIFAAQKLNSTGNFEYIGSNRLCFSSRFGLFVRKDLLQKLTSHTCIANNRN